MANLKEIEQYLSDLDNLRDTGHFSKENVSDYTFSHKNFTLDEMISKGREYIRQLSMIHKGIAEKRQNEVTEALPLYSVVQQRELLINFMTFYDGDENSVLHDDMVKIIDLYLEN